VGGGLRAYSANAGAGTGDAGTGDAGTGGAVAVLDGYRPDEMCSGGRGQILMPWPNRIAGGRYAFGGREYQLDLSEPARRNAIHGLTRWAEWELDATGPGAVTARHVIQPRPGYPFRLGCQADYALGPDGLTVRLSMTNLGSAAAPAGIGIHPYLTVGTPTVDGAWLRVPARRLLVADERGIPARTQAVAGTQLDYRTGRPIGTAILDTAYTDLVRDADGRVRVRLSTSPGTGANPGTGGTGGTGGDGGTSVVVWADETFGYLQVFTGDTLAPAARRRGVAIEPMTCPADAFNSGAGLAVLEPGATLSGAWGITPGG
jgi:aldose 1-epimerase